MLSAKALERDMRVLIYTPDKAVSEVMNQLLWSASATAFLPHCSPQNELAALTPIIIQHEADGLLHDEVLLNLRSEHPPFFSRFQRLIEIVSTDEADRLAARDRFKFYRDRGYEIRSHDLSKGKS
ncbi:DNA polymerase III chi subunit [Sulfurirhabdus autotrophica]|uniref:DNA polymerase III chi subunit n=2 Tax=Sulfurirhabdus autotrophica TaxID=1706046 RepID=A0A4R3XTN5_9PROT|nr:DNA polymerase III chi subunit [Sulfurirhabdus autotrophica]